jgi:putative inorganic carbon (hco3(-)) transporter
MSRRCNNPMTSNLPMSLETSAVAAPFLSLSRLAAENIHQWLTQSQSYRVIASIFRSGLNTIQQKSASQPLLQQTLKRLHLLSLFGTLVLSTFATTDAIAVAAVISFVFLLLRGCVTPLNIRPTVVDVLVILFFSIALVATGFSSYVHTSVIGMAKFSVFLMGFWNFRVTIETDRRVFTWLLVLLVVLGFGESLIGFYQYIHHVQPLATWQDTSLNPEDQLTRIFGTLLPSNPNLLAGFLIPCAAAGIGLALQSLQHRRWWIAAILLAMSMTSLLALVATGSRGGFLAIMTMGVITFLYLGHLLWHDPTLKEKYRLKAAWILIFLGATGGALLGVFLLPALRTRFLSIFAMRNDSSNSYRMNVWISTIRMIKDNWLLGIGPGNDTFKQVYGLYMTPGYNALSAYSIFLEMWAEQGIFGLLVFLLLLAVLLGRACLAFYSTLPLDRKIMIGALFAGIMGSVVYGLFDTIWYRPSVNLLFWLFMAGISSYSEAALSELSKASKNAAI